MTIERHHGRTAMQRTASRSVGISRVVLIAAAALAAPVHAAVTFISFEQHARAWALVNPPGVTPIEQSYDRSPVNPAASWSPSFLRIDISSPIQNSFVNLDPSYQSIVLPTVIENVSTMRARNGTTTGNAYTYDQYFSSVFTVDVVTEVYFQAETFLDTSVGTSGVQRLALLNETTGTAVFENPVFQDPLPGHWLLDSTFTLAPGTYRVTSENSGGGGGLADARRASVYFRMIVPAPAATPVLAAAVLVFTHRRRRSPRG